MSNGPNNPETFEISCERRTRVQLTKVEIIPGMTKQQLVSLLRNGFATWKYDSQKEVQVIVNYKGEELATFQEIQETADAQEYGDFQA